MVRYWSQVLNICCEHWFIQSRRWKHRSILAINSAV